MVYMISYDLHEPTNNREQVMNDIEALGTWCKYLTTTFLVKTNEAESSVESACAKHLDGNDRMIITQVPKMVSGWLSDEQWKWIRDNIFD
jgi:hypothetical protein